MLTCRKILLESYKKKVKSKHNFEILKFVMIYNLEGHDRFCLMNQNVIFIKGGVIKENKLLFLLIKVAPKSI